MDLSKASRLAELALDMAGQPDLRQTLTRGLDHALDYLGGDGAGILLARDGSVEAAAATDEAVRRADELRLRTGEGPCGVTDSDLVHLVRDTRTDDRWPGWGGEVAALGFRSVLSVGLCSPVRALGALTLYARTPDAFDESDAEQARIFARHASIAVMGAQHAESLKAAVLSRHVIGQAQGMLMERYNLEAEHTFTVLRRYSQHHNIKLRTVAEQVIETGQLPGLPSA